MPYIILKKTFKLKNGGFQVAAEKAFTLHGRVDPSIVVRINKVLASIRTVKTAASLQFKLDSAGHYYAAMNHDYQKHHEEDAIAAILDTMEIMSFSFRFQYDQQLTSDRVTGQSETRRECFIFHKP